MEAFHIQQLQPQRIDEAARMLAQAFATNPLHVAAFGANQFSKNEAFFQEGLRRMKGTRMAAFENGRIVGVIHWARAPACQFSPVEKLAMAPAMLRAFGARSSVRVAQWLSVWSRHDPGAPHVHLGPIGVSPAAQGRRIGHQLMKVCCDELDRGGEAGYLETDRQENVKFYERFGFRVTGEVQVLGIRNFLMGRPVST